MQGDVALAVFPVLSIPFDFPSLSVGFKDVDGVIYAGDYLSYGSQNGALAAGRAVGAAVVMDELV